MKAAKNKLTKEIAKLQKEHDLIMKKFYRTQTDENTWGDGRLYEQADNVAENKQLLVNAVELIEKYETKTASYK